MKKLTLSWLAAFAVLFTGLVLHAEEVKDDGDAAKPAEKGDPGRGKGKGDHGPDPKRIFSMLDKNDDGAISLKEFSEARPLADASKKEVAEIFKKRDLNHDGSIGPVEFAKTMDHGKGKGHDHDKGRPKGKGKGPGKGGKGDAE